MTITPERVSANRAEVPKTVLPGRLFYLDVARVLAIFGVAAIHNWSLLHAIAPGTRAWWAVDVLFTFGRWAVPVFVMISGGLLLRPGRKEGALEFYKRRLWRIGIPSVVWIAAYFVFRARCCSRTSL